MAVALQVQGGVMSAVKKHYRQSKNGVSRAKETFHGERRKCCEFCIKISREITLHSWCCSNQPHAHDVSAFYFRHETNKGPTKLSDSEFIDNTNGHGVSAPVKTRELAIELVKKLRIKETV